MSLFQKPPLNGCALLIPIEGYELPHYVALQHRDGSIEVPGGHVEEKEKPRFAAFREAIEEVGLATNGLRPLYDGHHTGRNGELYHAWVFVCEPVPNRLFGTATSEGSGCKVVAVTEHDLTGPKSVYRDLMTTVFMNWVDRRVR